jgi:hypothetical protein
MLARVVGAGQSHGENIIIVIFFFFHWSTYSASSSHFIAVANATTFLASSLPPPPPQRTCDTPRMLSRMMQYIEKVPPSSFSLSLSSQTPLAPTCADHRQSTSYSFTPIAGWLSFVRLSLASRKTIVLRVVILCCSVSCTPLPLPLPS